MNRCAYCNCEISIDAFFCQTCDGSLPDPAPETAPTPIEVQEEVRAKSPVESANLNPKPVKVSQSESKNSSLTTEKNTDTTDDVKLKPKETPSKPALAETKTSTKKEKKSNQAKKVKTESPWSHTDIHPTLKVRQMLMSSLLVAAPLLLLAIGPFTDIFNNFGGGMGYSFACVLYFVFGIVVYFTDRNWVKFASWAYERTESSEVYFFSEYNHSKSKFVIRIYDVDKLYPELDEVGEITLRSGNLSSLNWNRMEPRSLVPATMKVRRFGKMRVLILENNGCIAWCNFSQKS